MAHTARAPERKIFTFLVKRIILHELKSAFRKVCLAGEPPLCEATKPVVFYANHHGYHDGYLGWLAAEYLLNRPLVTWMQEWDRYPLFAPLGALPFPADDPARRAATIRRTVRRLNDQPNTVFLYFPEGRLHPSEEGILPFDGHALQRLGAMLPEAVWIPLALHVGSWDHARPVALIAAGKGREGIDGSEHELLEQLWQALRATRPEKVLDILAGRRSAGEALSLRPLATYFRRFT